MWLVLKEKKYKQVVVKFDNGKKFYRGYSLEEAKEAFLNQYKKKCTHSKRQLKAIKKQQSK